MKYFLYLFVLFTIIFPFSARAATFGDCSDGWEITGYYVPSEADFTGTVQRITTAEGEIRQLRKDFLETVLIEGSGRSLTGEIIEWYWDSWHINDKPEDYFGDELIIGTVATDPEVIPHKTRLTIPSLQSPFNETIYTSNDIGPAIKGKHIDVFMGFGKHALDEAWKFPDYNTVCIETDEPAPAPKAENIPAPSAKTTLTIISGSDLNLIFAKQLSGRILLQVEENGEAWYVYPADNKRYYLGRPDDAFRVMSNLGLGATHEFISKYTVFPAYVSGKILIDTQDSGKAYYIYPGDRKAYYLGRPDDAFRVMSNLGLGITNINIEKIEIGEIK